MTALIVVHPPSGEGERQVTSQGNTLGRARGMVDVIEFMRRAGLDVATIDLHDDSLIEWRGGGPETWR